MAEMVPANQGVVAITHTSQSAEGTPILDTSTSSDSHMGDARQINLTQFNQLNQQHVLNLTADPMILAEAQRVVAEVQQEARQSRDQVISEARDFVQSSQEIASLQARAHPGKRFPMKLLSMFKPLQGIFKVSLMLHVSSVSKPEINYKILVHVSNK